MPTSTFEQLPPDKRRRIIELARAEFAEHPYGLASLSRIVAQAGIAKGSMYQYFADKRELYLFILEDAAREQLALLREQTPPEPEAGFFALLRWQMQASVRVGLAAPRLTRLMYRATTDELPFRDELSRRLGGAGEHYLHTMLADAVARGEIDEAVDLELAAFVLRRAVGDLHLLLLRRHGLSLDEVAARVELLDTADTGALFDRVVQILQFGLSPRAQVAPDQGEPQ